MPHIDPESLKLVYASYYPAECYVREEAIAVDRQTSTGIWASLLGMTLFSAFSTIVCIILDTFTRAGLSHSMAGFSIFAILIIAGSLAWKFNAKRRQANRRLWQELTDEPLYSRAALILRAAREYGLHLMRYEHVLTLEESALSDEDREARDYSLQLMQRAKPVIERAGSNWNATKTLREGRDKFNKNYPNAKAGDSAITEIMRRLNAPIADSTNVRIADAEAILTTADALEEIESELGDRGLTQRIERATRTAEEKKQPLQKLTHR